MEEHKIHDEKKEHEVHEHKKETKVEDKKTEVAKAEKKEEHKKAVDRIKKTEAVVNGNDLPIGRKHAVAICDFIRNKNIEIAINQLEQVVKMKLAIPMKGEIPHRHAIHVGSGSGRYPVKASGIFIKLLKSLKANAIANDLELEKVKIFCKANKAARPYKRFGQGRFKRVHIEIKLIPRLKPKKLNEVKK